MNLFLCWIFALNWGIIIRAENLTQENESPNRIKRGSKSSAFYGGSSPTLCDSPMAPKNGGLSCNANARRMYCTATCITGFRFPDGTELKKHSCSNHDGTWLPDMEFPDCQPVCDPPCQNGGECYGNNRCVCTPAFRGDKCEYAVANCDGSNLHLTGNWACNHTSLQTLCTVSCPPGFQFEYSPANVYTCDLGGNWLPKQVPKCIQMNIAIHQYTSTLSPTLQPAIITKVESAEKRSGVCSSWGQLHYRTFDGNTFSVQGLCTYLLMRDCSSDTFAIHVKNDPGCNGVRNCQRTVIIYVNNNKYTLESTAKGPSVLWGLNRLKIPATINGLAIEEVAHYITVKSGLGFAVRWNGKDVVTVEAEAELFNKTCGLCGRFDGRDSNDFEMVDGTTTTNVAALVNSWKMNNIGDTCTDASKLEHTCKYDIPENQYLSDKADEFCSRLMSPEYAICHSLLDAKPYFEMCRLDYCACGADGEKCACSSLSAYFQEFHRLGGTLPEGWRKPDFCSIECRGDMVYQDCGSSCPKTCKKTALECPEEQCVDGCHCPKGTVLHDHQCIEEGLCPCFYSGRTYPNGQSIQQDCNACLCSGGVWQCTHEKCDARCSSVGDPHYTTFDGKRFNFMGKCSYYLMYADNYTIEQENVACSGAISENMGFIMSPGADYPSCTKSVTIRFGETTIVIDGKEVTNLPVSAGGIYVYATSSLYVKVELENGLSITWDGASSVYIDAPKEFYEKTKGLCGTYNHNQKDDFLTDEGDIEQNTGAFANKWKTTESCQDIALGDKLQDPCDVFPQRKQKAQWLCGSLKSEIFSACHDVIEPEPFFKDCMYDMCYCQTKLGDCLCPAIANYAAECSKKGSPVEWRSHVRECGLNCPGGQTYQVCGSTCKRSCTDIAYHVNCREQCVEGCNCPPGTTLDGDGECIPISSCPCIHGHKNFLPGHTDLRGNLSCECTNARWECRPATESELSSSHLARLQEKPSCSAAANMEYTDCISDCPVTCKNMHTHTKCKSPTCKPGCRCMKGYVLDTKTSHCVKSTQCPCHHGGQSYGEGEMIQEDCNTCVCEGGVWKCEKKECPGTCTAWGDSHFKTFDERLFEFHGDCDYVLVKGGQDKYDKFLVTIHNVPCGSSDITCAKSVSFNVGDEKVKLTAQKPLPKSLYGKRYLIRQVGLYVIVHTDIGITLQWDKGTRVYVRADIRWKSKLEGLCGNFNGDEIDDFKASDGGLPIVKPTVFGDSWRLRDYCPVSKVVNNTCDLHPNRKSWAQRQCSVLKSPVFRPCHSEVPYEPYLERCIFDSCGCDMGGDCHCLCTALAAYAQECNMHGVGITWRSQELCPIQCETCAKYTSCMSVCPPKTCETQYLYSGIEESCGRETCVEGCEPKPCPTGQMFTNDRDYQCIPDGSCTSQPCKLINGRMHHEGERINDPQIADMCQSCYCRSGDIVCLGRKCAEVTQRPPITTTSTTPMTTVSNVAKCEQNGWSEWMNGFSPTFKNGGDYETFELLRKRQFTFCPLNNTRHIECRTAATHKHYKETGQNVWCSLPEGLICENKDQPSVKLCYDYEIRIYCQCAPDVTEVETTTSLEETTTKSPQHAIKCMAPGWTEWMNSQEPTANGESEIIPNLRKRYAFCSEDEIGAVECRVADRPRATRATKSSSNAECTKDRGLVCKASKGRTCQDYEVRFYCHCGEADCDYPRGMETGAIDDRHISVSSFKTPLTLGHRARLNGKGAWSAGKDNDNQWIEIDLSEIQEITGLVTQGNPNGNEWVTSFKVGYGNDGKQWHSLKDANGYDQIFLGNRDRSTLVKNMFDAPIRAQFIRLLPVEWENWISLRLEILGCNRIVTEQPTILPTTLPYETTTVVVETTTTPVIPPTSTKGTPFPYQCLHNGWTEWMNVDLPETTRQYEILSGSTGDVESIDELRYFYSFCAHPVTVECRASYTQQMAHLTGQKVKCDLDGVVCRNDLQADKQCLDYEIRFYCECEETTTYVTTLPTTAGIARCTDNEWTEWLNGNDPERNHEGDLETYKRLRPKFSFCASEYIADIECRVAETHESFREAGQYGVVCDQDRGLQCLNSMQPSGKCKDYEVRFYCLCQEIVTHIMIPTATQETDANEAILEQTATSGYVTMVEPQVICNAWTSWINMDTPYDDGNDFELLRNLPDFGQTCPKPVSFQCRDAHTKANFYQTGQNFKERCNANGIVCESTGQSCNDYEIRVFCTCPTPPPETTCQPGWTQWFDTDDPSVGEGDFEQIEDIRQKYELCPTELITDIQCQSRSFSVGVKQFGKLGSKGSKASSSKAKVGKGVLGKIRDGSSSSRKFDNWLDYTETGDVGVKCSKSSGLACYNSFQKRKCRDYRVRFYCSCGGGKVTYKPWPTARTTKGIDEEEPATEPTTSRPILPAYTPVPSNLCGWTNWLNADNPIINAEGDFETIEKLQAVYNLCERSAIKGIECRLAEPKISWDTSGQHGLVCNADLGFRCSSALQPSGCYDYEVRVACVPDWCQGTTSIPTTETTATITTTPPCKPGMVWSDCAYKCDRMCQSFLYQAINSDLCNSINNSTACVPGCIAEECEPPNVWRDEATCVKPEDCTCMLEDGQIVPPGEVFEMGDCEQCQCITNTLHCEVTQGCGHEPTSKNQQQEVTLEPYGSTDSSTDFNIFTPRVPIPIELEDCWTEWINLNSPADNKLGDIEDLATIRSHYSFCSEPVAIECRTADGSKRSALETKQNIECDPKAGLVCWNRLNWETSGCHDYEVRFFCPCAASTTISPTDLTDTTTESETTTIEELKPIENEDECAPGFTSWFNVHHPDAAGEYENVQDIRQAGYKFCSNNYITAMECRVQGTGTPHHQSEDHGVTCNFLVGLYCENRKQHSRKKCLDYEVRFFCDCGFGSYSTEAIPPTTLEDVPTTPASTEAETTPEVAILVTTGLPCSYWTEWINDDKPWLGNGDIEYRPSESICQDGEVQDIQCVLSDSNIPYTESNGRNIKCSIAKGFSCRNNQQPGRMCNDYKIRYYCGCVAIETTEPPVTESYTVTSTSAPMTTGSITIIIVPPPPPSKAVPCEEYMYYINNEFAPLPDSRLQASSSLDALSGPHSGRLQSIVSPTSDGAWIPRTKNNEYIQVDLIKPQIVYGVATQGHSILHSWVTSYEILFGKDGIAFSYALNPDGSVKIFKGNYDNGNIVTNLFETPFEARYVRIIPKTWKSDIALRFDLLGCAEFKTSTTPATTANVKECDEPMGLENGQLSDRQIQASSYYDDIQGPNMARLNGQSNWAPKISDKQQYLRFDFMEPRVISGVSTQGRESAPQWVTSYALAYSNDELTWTSVTDEFGNPQIFAGNFDGTTVVTNHVDQPIRARYLRFIPQTWHNWIALRLEIKGCFEPYPTPGDLFQPTEAEDVTTTTEPPILTTVAVNSECTEYMNEGLQTTQIEVSSSLAGIRSGAPRLALNTLEKEDTGGWVAGQSNRRQFVLIDYGIPLNLTGIVTQGRNKHPEWVTDYEVLYSNDKQNWISAYDELGNTVFPGNEDKDTPVQHFFTPAITAIYIKIVPVKWHNWISMRLEILGCPANIDKDEDGMLTEPTEETTPGGCYSYGPWLSLHTPAPGTPGDMEPIDELISKTNLCISPVKIECRETLSHVAYDALDQKVTCDLYQGLTCLNQQQSGQQCYNYEARIACWTCDVTTELPTTPQAVIVCPEIPARLALSCPATCPTGRLCDGQQCVDPAVDCPCYRDGKLFKPGERIETSSCEECTCGLKGHSYCVNKTCPKCSYGVEGTPNEHCQCECKTCPKGHLICPTNLHCLAEHLWCDGIVDCPDDENDCAQATPATTVEAPTRCPPQPIPTCPPDTELALQNPSDPCPAYTCVPIPSVTSISPPPIKEPEPTVKYFCEMSSNYFKTFDGLGYQYDICKHVIIQDKINRKFNVTVQKDCSDVTSRCTKHLIVSQDDWQIQVDGQLEVKVGGRPYTDSQLTRLARKSSDIAVKIIGDSVIIKSSKYGYEVDWNSEENARFGVIHTLVNKIHGLCGYFSLTPDDDKTTPQGQVVQSVTEFGDSWSIGSQEQCTPLTCPAEVLAEAIAACHELRRTPFDACNEAVDPSYHIQVCVASICECLTNTNLTDKDCRCKAYLPYVEACEMKNVAKIRYWRVKQSCLPNCPPGLVWQDCGSACERTCDNLHDYNIDNATCNSDRCVSGCFCPAGLVRKGDHCVQPEKCQDCVCKGYGDPHYFTYDGLYYPFQGNCTYVLSQDIVRPGEPHKFQVYATNEDCHEEPLTTCTVAIMVLFNDHLAHFRVNESVTFDGVQLYPSDFPFHAFGIHIESIPGRSVTFSVPEAYLEVRYFELNYGFEVRIPSEIYHNKTEGLCGNCNFNSSDDLCCRDGKMANTTDEFAFSWIATPPEGFESVNEICKLKEDTGCKPTIEEERCDRLLSEEFVPCHALVDPEVYLTSCRFDACRSVNPTASICRAMTEYARKCAEVGICIQNWRTDDFCPYECPAGMYFDQCGPKCPKSCKDITPNGWAPVSSREGKDILPDLADWSLQQTMQELADVCDTTPVDGCFCVGGKVLKDGKCVDPVFCEICDDGGHKVSDSWQPNPCTSCTCTRSLTVECIKIECAPKPTCTTDESLRVTSADNATCCDKYQCVPKEVESCPEPDMPACNAGEIVKLDRNTPDGCPRYVCECDISQCPSLQVPTQLQLGEESVIDRSGCCPTQEIVCKPEKCPEKPICSKDHTMKERKNPKSRCCPEYYCEPPPNVCLYTHQYDVIDGKQVKLRPDAFVTKAHKGGEIWMDGLCRKCTCEAGYDQYRHRCTVEICPRLEDYQDNADYIWIKEPQPDVCCPKFLRTGCVVNGKNYTIGEEWASPDGDKCKHYRCGNLPSGEAIRIEKQITCMKECDLGASYMMPPASSPDCCGKCEPVACVEDGKLYTVGEVWNSTVQKCFSAECRKVEDVIQMRYSGKVCPPIPVNCIKKLVDSEGCCDICNDTSPPSSLHACKPERMRPVQTIGMFNLFENQAKCTNRKPILNMMSCVGHCQSTSVYSSDQQDFTSSCNCCTPTRLEKRTLFLECSDGKKRPIEYSQPVECDCTANCGLGTEQGGQGVKKLDRLKAVVYKS